MSTQADENTIRTLSEAQIEALGGMGDVLTWLAWMRKYREFVKPIMAGFEDFVNATSWGARMAAIGKLLDSIGAIIDTVPVAAEPSFLLLARADDAEAIETHFVAASEEFTAMGINWVGLVGKLPQLIAFLQVAGEMLKRFRAPAAAMSAAVVVPPIHGLVYRPFATAA